MRARKFHPEMQILFITSVLLVIAWSLHILLWRIRLPRHQIPALLLIAAAVLGGWLVLARTGSWLEILQIALLYGASSFCYVITYSAVEGDSPTLSLTRLLAEKGKAGLPREEVEGFLAARPFVRARLAALIHSGLIREERGYLYLVGRPSLSFRVVLTYRKLYGPISRGG